MFLLVVTGGEKQAGQPYPHPGGLLKGVGGRCEKEQSGGLCQGALVVLRALREVSRERRGACQENLEIQIVVTLTVNYL